jgi:hypothetical protein
MINAEMYVTLNYKRRHAIRLHNNQSVACDDGNTHINEGNVQPIGDAGVRGKLQGTWQKINKEDVAHGHRKTTHMAHTCMCPTDVDRTNGCW